MNLLKLERQRLGLKQSEVCEFLSVNKGTYIRWESDKPMPVDKLRALEELGFDVSYVLTGKRLALNEAALKECIEGLEGVLERTSTVLPADVKAKLIAFLYEEYMDDGDVDVDKIQRHLRLVS